MPGRCGRVRKSRKRNTGKRDPVTENLTRKCYHIVTENTNNIYLAPGQAPKAVFELGGEKPVAVYAYCNLHGLWMTKL